MKLLRKIVSLFWERLFVLCGVLYVLLPTSPLNMPFTYRDSGVFLYFGWRIINGELPYRDLWDHKPPVVFYINALGLAITNQSRWGVWLIELAALFLAALIGFYLLKKTLGNLPALFSSLIWLLTLAFVIQGGNLTTEYTLPLQFAALWFAKDIDETHFPYWRYLLIGFIGAVAFFTKQTSIGIWAAIVLYIIVQRCAIKQLTQLVRELMLISTGSLAVVGCIVVFFWVQDALPQFWSAAFEYNFVYSSTVSGLMNRIRPVVYGITPLTSTSLFQLSMMGYLFTIILVFYKKALRVTNKLLPLVLIGLLDIPIELILISISGNTHPHYYITLLPALSLFAGFLYWILTSQLSSAGVPSSMNNVLIIGVMVILIWSSFGKYQDQVIEQRNVRDETTIEHIMEITAPDDLVLFWGAEASINFFSQRRCPTRFVYQYPLYQKGYANEQMIEEFLLDIIRKQPRLIVDVKNPRTPMYDFQIRTKTIKANIAYIKSHYKMIDNTGSWTIYEYTGDNPK